MRGCSSQISELFQVPFEKRTTLKTLHPFSTREEAFSPIPSLFYDATFSSRD